MMGSKESLKKGIAITFVSKYSNVVIQLVVSSILARLLNPSEFGIIAIVNVFIAFFAMLGDMGLGPAIIQNKSLENKEISDIFKFSIVGAIILAIGFGGFSHLIAFFYNDFIYIKIGYLLSVTVFFSILNIVPNSLLFKAKRFKAAGWAAIVVNVFVGMLTVILAINGWSYYALVIDSILKSILNFILIFALCNIRIEKGFSFKSIDKIKNYSIYQFSFNFINYFTRNLDNILIGKFLGASTLGFYDKAYKLVLYPVQNLTNVVTPVLHPVLSEYQNDKELIYNTYLKVIKVLAYLGVFITVFCYFAATEIIQIMYGDNWNGAIRIFQILSLTIVIQMVLSSIGSIFQATGYVNKLFSTGVVSSIFTITAILIGITKGSILILASGITIAFYLNFIQSFYVLITQVFNRSFFNFLLELKNVGIIGIVMVIGYLLTKSFTIENIFLSMCIKLVIGLVGYCIGLLLTKEYLLVKKILFKK